MRSNLHYIQLSAQQVIRGIARNWQNFDKLRAFRIAETALRISVRPFSLKPSPVSCATFASYGQIDYILVWPEPSMSHLYVVISRRPIGPRAPSFWVLMPISAPRPNCAPSVKLVGALT